MPELFAPLPRNEDSSAARGQQYALRPLSEVALTPDQVQHGLCALFQRASQRAPLLLAVDDVGRMDQPSAAVLAALLDDAEHGALCVALSADAAELQGGVAGTLARRCVALPIRALTRAETRRLFESLFGTAAHLETIADEIHGVAAGSPGKALDAAQHLVDRGVVRYEAGVWILPSQLTASDLPRDAREAVRARAAALSATARHLVELQALAFYATFTDTDYHALVPQLPTAEVEQALSELATKRVIIRAGPSYQLDNRLWQAALVDQLDADALAQCHAALADFYEPRSAIALIHHAFAAGQDERGLDALIEFQDELRQKPDMRPLLTLNLGKMVPCYDLALHTALKLGRSRRQISELRRWMMGGTIAIENGLYNESARAWLEQLVHDSGLDLYRNADAGVPADQRLMSALQGAQQRHLELPEERRAYGVEESIRLLPEYVVFAIALGARSQDCALLHTLPELLEPFRVLSPLIDAIWKNAVATYAQLSCQLERSVELWREVLSALDAISGSDVRQIEAIANAVALALGNTEAQLGWPDAVRWADRLDSDPYQRISALQLRRIVRLERGDWKGAEQLRRQGEVLALQMQSPQMFYTLLIGEVAVCSQVGDLRGLQDTIERIRAVSEVHAGWRFNLISAEGHLDFARGDYLAALPKFERCCALCAFDANGFSPNPGVWLSGQAGLAQTLLALGRSEPARAAAAAALQVCDRRGVEGAAWELVCVLALAEAKLGQTQAAARLDAFIEQQVARGVGGLRLGLCYETRARIAIATHDADGFRHYAGRCAHEYRHGTGSFVGARYERLLNEGARQGLHGRTLRETAAADGGGTNTLQLLVSRTMSSTQRADARAMAAVELVCEAFCAPAGHLFLRRGQDIALAASHGASGSVHNELLELVRSHWAVERAHAESLLTEMVTGAVNGDDALFAAARCEVRGVCYRLTVLRGSSAGVPRVAGIVAMELAAAPELNPVQVQLIQLIASALLDSGDATVDGALER